MIAPIVTGLLVAVFGAVVVWAGHASVRPDIDPGSAPGLRTPSTVASRQAWLAAHRPIAPFLRGLGWAIIAVGVALAGWAIVGSPSDRDVDVVLAVTAGVFLASTVVMIGVALIAVRRLHRR